MGVKYLEAYSDSKLVVNQVKGEYDVKNEDLIPYHQVTVCLADIFQRFFVDHVSQKDNTYVNALESLATTIALPSKLLGKAYIIQSKLWKLT